MSDMPAQRLYTAAQSRAIDDYAIRKCNLPGPQLMARAARAAFALLLSKVSQPELLQIFCGPGNNGGDGLLLALLAHGRGIRTRVFLVDGEPRSEDARRAAERARACGVLLEPFVATAVESTGVVVDAMLGTGISGPVRPAYRSVIERIESLGLPVLALDIPSGLNADTGCVQGIAVRAQWTISFITAKRGLFTADGPDCGGELSIDDLDVPPIAYTAAGSACEVLSLDAVKAFLPARSGAAHKGAFGRLLLVGGDHGMGGAIVLAAEAALRTGVGLTAVATRPEHLAPLLTRSPECMARGVQHRNDLEPLLAWADSIVIGPGLGRAPWGQQMLHACLASAKPLLLDADALNLVAADARGVATLLQLPACVLTPHPGEAARLLGCTTAEVQAQRFESAATLVRRSGGAVVLKGNGSLVADVPELSLCAAGNPGMASGGMGDVLSGIIGGLLAQGLTPGQAARLGTVLHAMAGDRAAQRVGQPALLASDLIPELGPLLR